MAESLKCRLVLATFEVAGRGVFAASAVWLNRGVLPEANFQDMVEDTSILAIEIRNESGNMEIEHQVLVDKY